MRQWSTQDYVYTTAECVTGVLSFVGNGLVLLAIAKNRSLQTTTNCFIGSLAAADALVGLILPPTVILPYFGLPKNFYGCVMINSIVVLITNISILNLLTVALERYLAISDPFRYYQIMSIKSALIVVGLTWVVAILIGLVPMMGWNLGDEGFQTCSFAAVMSTEYMVYLSFFVVTLVPLFLMLLIYCYIFYIIRKQMRNVAHLSQFSIKGQQKQKREVRGAIGLAFVIILFTMCWMPMDMMNTITVFASGPVNIPIEWVLFAIVLSHANSVVNPFLYAFANSKFKRAIKNIVLCQNITPSDTDVIDGSKTGQTKSTVVPKTSIESIHGQSSTEVLDSMKSSPEKAKFP